MSAKNVRIAIALTVALVLSGCDTQPAAAEHEPRRRVRGRRPRALVRLRRQHRRGRAGGAPGRRPAGQHVYHYRIRSRLSNGQTIYFDSNGTNGGTAYDGFITRTDLFLEKGGVIGSSDEASASVNAERLCNWSFSADLDTRSSDTKTWARARTACGSNRSVWHTCSPSIWDSGPGWAIYTNTTHGSNSCNAFVRSTCADWCQTARGAQAKM